jgi:hypothetical protein
MYEQNVLGHFYNIVKQFCERFKVHFMECRLNNGRPQLALFDFVDNHARFSCLGCSSLYCQQNI